MLNIKQSGFVSSFLGQSELLRFLGDLDLLGDYHGRCSPLGCVGGLTKAEPPSVLLIEVQHMAGGNRTDFRLFTPSDQPQVAHMMSSEN